MNPKIFEPIPGTTPMTEVELEAQRLESERLPGEREYLGMKERFGDRFLGLDTLEKVFTLPDGTRLFDITPEVREHAYRALQEKLAEHDHEIAFWMDRILAEYPPLKKEEFDNWMFVYHPSTNMRIDLQDLTKRGPITVNNLLRIDGQLMNRSNGSSKYIRYIWSQLLNEPWLNTHCNLGWTLMTKDFVPSTRSKTMDQQRVLVEEFARTHGFDGKDDGTHFILPSPIDLVLNAHLANTNGIPYLKDWNYERTTQRTASGLVADVGNLDSNGVVVSASGGEPGSGIGASVSR